MYMNNIDKLQKQKLAGYSISGKLLFILGHSQRLLIHVLIDRRIHF